MRIPTGHCFPNRSRIQFASQTRRSSEKLSTPVCNNNAVVPLKSFTVRIVYAINSNCRHRIRPLVLVYKILFVCFCVFFLRSPPRDGTVHRRQVPQVVNRNNVFLLNAYLANNTIFYYSWAIEFRVGTRERQYSFNSSNSCDGVPLCHIIMSLVEINGADKKKNSILLDYVQSLHYTCINKLHLI